MKVKTIFLSFVNWLKSPEVFGSISKKIPGKWLLFEYYIDSDDQLLNFKDKDLKEKNWSLQLEFRNDGTFVENGELRVILFQDAKQNKWSVSKNFITLIHPENFRNNIEFQFAFEKGNLKLLKKDSFGKIKFFGFFKSANPN